MREAMRKLFIIIAVLVCAAANTSASESVVPAPAHYEAVEGSFAMPERLVVAGADSRSGKDASKLVRYIAATGLKASKGQASKAHVKVTHNASLGAEQYTLAVSPSGIEVGASTDAGLMYAAETLRQLVDAGQGSVKACRIDDSPRFGYRGFMLDVVRNFIPADEVKKFIDVAASLKLNNVHLHLTDDNGWRVEIKKYPRLTEVGAWRVAREDLFPGRLNARSADEPATEGGFYTQKELRELVRYAAERNVNIVPEIEMPAHAIAAIASYPSLACPVVDKFVGVFPGIGGKDASIIMCAGNEHTYTFICDVLDEVMDIFPSKNIHLGGDEANKAVWEKCPLCNERIAAEHLDGHEGLQAYLMDRINHYVRSKGRTAMGWDEVTYGNPKEDMIIYGWQGDGGVAVRDSRASGRKFILTPAKTLYLIRYQGPQWFEPFTYFGNNTLRNVYDYEPFGADWNDTLKGNLLGVQGSLWSEFCKSPQDAQYLVFPRLVALADVAWRPEGRADWPAFLNALDNYLPTLDRKGVIYARSMFNLDHKVVGDGKDLLVSATCIRPDVEVRYALNAENFGAKSIMPDTLRVNSPTTVYAATFRGDEQLGKTLALNLGFNKATARPVSGNCRNGLGYALTNGLRGSDRNSDFEWAGWWNETAEFTVDLGKKTKVNEITLGTLVHADICVAAPRRIYVYTSPDGTSYKLQRAVDVDDELIFHPKARVVDIKCGGADEEARYVKLVAINPGGIPDGLAREGAATWMYFDEVMVD